MFVNYLHVCKDDQHFCCEQFLQVIPSVVPGIHSAHESTDSATEWSLAACVGPSHKLNAGLWLVDRIHIRYRVVGACCVLQTADCQGLQRAAQPSHHSLNLKFHLIVKFCRFIFLLGHIHLCIRRSIVPGLHEIQFTLSLDWCDSMTSKLDTVSEFRRLMMWGCVTNRSQWPVTCEAWQG